MVSIFNYVGTNTILSPGRISQRNTDVPKPYLSSMSFKKNVTK